MKEKYVYPQKVLLAWGECIKGNKEISEWLRNNGYKELFVFALALRNEERAKEWLLKNGFPHLLA